MSSLSNPSPGFCPIITLVHLYPQEMSLNGDRGNVLVLQRRMQWRGIPFVLIEHHPGDPLPQSIDLIVGGGPQITGASSVQQDLLRNKELLHACIESGTAALLIGGSFQLFGNHIELTSGEKIEGLGIFNMHTVNGGQRFSGNVVANSELFGTIVGFENHSAKSYLSAGLSPLAQATTGAGNNGADKSEGARYRHAIGSYLQGPLLPKNPAIADFLIAKALKHRLGEMGEMREQGDPSNPEKLIDPSELAPLPHVDDCAARAAVIALTRPR